MTPPVLIEQTLLLPADEVGAALLGITEDQWFDRKSARIAPRSLGDALIGFANADGGTIVVGLFDGRVEGTDSVRRARNDLAQAPLDFCVPPVRATSRLVPCVTHDGSADHLLVFDVRPSAGVVHANRKDEVYLRVGDENRRLTFAQRQELTFDRGPGSYEARPLVAVDAADLDDELLDEYVAAVGSPDRERLLQARSLVDDGELNVAGWLLFARHPQARLPEAYVRVLRYQGSERGTGGRQRLLVDQRCEGPAPRVLREARLQIEAVQPTRRALGGSGRFEPVALIPADAWLEGSSTR